MWLLSTADADLRFFSDPGAVPGGYAIISHTWSPKGEQSFQEVHAIGVKCKETGRNPRDYVDRKIRDSCLVAERDGYAWVWMDTCCINKESSTELSEAINSMFSWYVLSEVCYAYLEDVHEGDDPREEDSEFRRSRWHTRGWTLQELLAPAFVVFLSAEWKAIGTKHDLSGPLSERTSISEGYLTRARRFFGASIAERMSWAAGRETTRIEDEAYCLLGLFSINMPIMYGEGRQAFQRLQQELAKLQYLDTTLFAWGSRHDDDCEKLPPEDLTEIWSGFHEVNHPERFLFATSPSDFSGSTTYYTPGLSSTAVLQPYLAWQWSEDNEKSVGDISKKETGPFGRIELPSCEVTSYGMKCRFPVAEIDGFTIAVLLVETNDEHLGMILHPAEDDELQDPSRKMHYVTWPFKTENTYFNCRLALLGGDLYNLQFRGKPVNATWRDIYIHASPRTSDRTDPSYLIFRLYPDRAPAPFRIPRRLVNTMIALKLLPDTGMGSTDPDASTNMWIDFTNTTTSEKVHVQLGICATASTGDAPCHWAYAESSDLSNWTAPWKQAAHDCAKDHIADWPGGARDFGDAERTIRLSFAPCKHAPPGRTRVLGLELSGTVYDGIQRAAGFTIAERAGGLDGPLKLVTHTGTPLTVPAPQSAAPVSAPPWHPVSAPKQDKTTERLSYHLGTVVASVMLSAFASAAIAFKLARATTGGSH